MFLKTVEIENLRCFETVRADFSGADSGDIRKWTILLGENGTGKSTFLKTLALITAGSDALTWLLPDPSAWVRNGQEQATLRATLATKAGEERQVEIVIRADDGPSEVIRRNVSGLHALDDALGHTERNYFVAGYGASRRLGDPSFSTQTSKAGRSLPIRAQSVATLFDASHELVSFESWAMSVDYRKQDEGLELVRDVLNRFTPNMSFHSIDRDRGALIFETVDGLVPLDQLSDGFQNVVGWVGDLLFRITQIFDDFKNPLSARGLLLIDEVDLHLHPIWQKRLIDLLDVHLPQMQLIVTTHSAITAQQADADTLFYFDRDGPHVHMRDFEGSPGRLRVNQLLTSSAFGLETDEALNVEQAKSRYRDLVSRPGMSDEEKREADEIQKSLGSDQLGLSREDRVISPDQIELLRRLNEKI